MKCFQILTLAKNCNGKVKLECSITKTQDITVKKINQHFPLLKKKEKTPSKEQFSLSH